VAKRLFYGQLSLAENIIRWSAWQGCSDLGASDHLLKSRRADRIGYWAFSGTELPFSYPLNATSRSKRMQTTTQGESEYSPIFIGRGARSGKLTQAAAKGG
jgi:hypothetical protein